MARKKKGMDVSSEGIHGDSVSGFEEAPLSISGLFVDSVVESGDFHGEAVVEKKSGKGKRKASSNKKSTQQLAGRTEK